MRRRIDNVEIKEPPIKELKRRRSCLRNSCTTGCGCLILLLIGSLLFLQFATNPRSKEVKKVPASVVQTVPLYDQDAIERITITSGKERVKVAKRLAAIPRLVASPILLAIERSEETTSSTQSAVQTVRQYLDTPIGDARDQVVIEWSSLLAKPGFIDTYYKTELKKRDFDIHVTSKSDTLMQFTFAHDDVEGVVFIQDDPTTDDTDYVLMTIDIPSEDA